MRILWPGTTALLAALVLGILVAWSSLEAAITLIAGSLVLLLTLVQPLFGLALALLAGPFGALEQLFSGIASVDSGQLLLLLALASWIGGGLARKNLRFPHTFISIPLAVFILIGSISILEASSAVAGLKEILKWLEIGAVMLMVVDLAGPDLGEMPGNHNRNILGGPRRTTWIIAMLLLTGTCQALIGIWQFALRGDGPEHFLVLGRFYRAYGTFEQPNPFGGFMNLGALLALGILVGLLSIWWPWLRKQGRSRSNGNSFTPTWRFLGVTFVIAAAAIIMSMALLSSWSRGAWLGYVSGLAVMLLFLPRKRVQGVLLVCLMAAAVLLVYKSGQLPGAVSERVTSFAEDFRIGDVRGEDINDENYSIIERQAHWQAGLAMLRDHLWLGIGFGNYDEAYADYALINWPDALGHAHNYYINLLAEVGMLGLAAYLSFWAAVFWQTIRLLRILAWPERGIALGLLAAWTALAVHHLVDKLYVNNIYIHLGVMLGLLQLLDWSASKTDPIE